MSSSPLTRLEELAGVEAGKATTVALPFPVLLRVPRLPPEHERPPLVLPPVDRPSRLGKILAGAMIILALFLMTRWQRWVVTPTPQPAPPLAPAPSVDDAVTLPPLRPMLTTPVHPTPLMRPTLDARQVIQQPTLPPVPPVDSRLPLSQPIIRPGAVHVRPRVPMPANQPRPHPIIVSVEPGG